MTRRLRDGESLMTNDDPPAKPDPREPAVLVRNTPAGWEVVGCFTTAHGEQVRRRLDLYLTEDLAKIGAAHFLNRLGRIRRS